MINNDVLIVDILVYFYFFDFDYFFVCFLIKSKFKRFNNNIIRKLYCYDKVDFDGLRKSLLYVLWDLFIFSDDIDLSVVFF